MKSWILAIVLLAFGLIAREQTVPVEIPATPSDEAESKDVELYRAMLDAQVDRLGILDTMLGVFAAISFAAMTYLLSSADVSRDGRLVTLTLVLMLAVALDLLAMIAFRPQSAPDLIAFDEELRADRSRALANAKLAMVEAYRDNLGSFVAKTRLLVTSVLLTTTLFLVVLLKGVVK